VMLLLVTALPQLLGAEAQMALSRIIPASALRWSRFPVPVEAESKP